MFTHVQGCTINRNLIQTAMWTTIIFKSQGGQYLFNICSIFVQAEMCFKIKFKYCGAAESSWPILYRLKKTNLVGTDPCKKITPYSSRHGFQQKGE